MVDAITGEPAPLPTDGGGFVTEGAASICLATLLRGASRWTVRSLPDAFSHRAGASRKAR